MEKVRAEDRARKATEEAREDRRARTATEEAREVDRARKATEEAREVRRARTATEEAREVDRARKATEEERESLRYRVRGMRANVSVKPKDGLQSEKVLLGQFQVSVNNIGEMSHLCQFCHARKFKNETGMTCCLNGK